MIPCFYVLCVSLFPCVCLCGGSALLRFVCFFFVSCFHGFRGFVALWFAGRGFVGLWFSWLCDFVLFGFVALWLCGFVASWLCGFAVAL